jgi:hypothetical protein
MLVLLLESGVDLGKLEVSTTGKLEQLADYLDLYSLT